jgi:4-hydroxy-4-methyl-2-oxoglutarate aldolase
MIKDPPLLSIRRRFARPAVDIVTAFRGVPTGYLVDAMGGRGALDHRIRPLLPGKSDLVGVALTCHAGPADNLAVFGAVAVAEPGDIIVAATDAFTRTSVTGDLLLGMAQNRGVAGFITDGLVRDQPGIAIVGLPVFCAGTTPNSPARNGPGTVGLPVLVGDVLVRPGDILVADVDGVVVVPQDEAAAVLSRLEGIRAAERALDEKVRGGLAIPDFIDLILNSGRVDYLD